MLSAKDASPERRRRCTCSFTNLQICPRAKGTDEERNTSFHDAHTAVECIETSDSVSHIMNPHAK